MLGHWYLVRLTLCRWVAGLFLSLSEESQPPVSYNILLSEFGIYNLENVYNQFLVFVASFSSIVYNFFFMSQYDHVCLRQPN